MLMLASIGALAAPTPAVSQEYDPCVECTKTATSLCHQLEQAATYRLCTNWCNQQYCGDYAAPAGPELLAARFD